MGIFPTASGSRQVFFPVTLIAAVGFALVAVLSGFRFCAGDIDTYLPFILHAQNPSLFANDLLLGTLNSHPVYLWKALGFFLAFAPIDLLIRIAFLFQTVAIVLGAFLFFRRFFGNGRGWMFFLLLLLVPVSAPGYGMYGLNPYGYFHAGALAFGLALLAYTLIDRGWWVRGGMLTGALFLIHPITAVYAAGFLFVRGIMEFRSRAQRLRLVTGWLLMVVIALPSLIPAVQTAFGGSGCAVDPVFWRALAKLRMNHGYFISAWVPERFIQVAACFGLLLVLWKNHPAWKRLLPIVIVVAGGLLCMAIADLFTIRFFLRLQLGRCSYFLFFLVTAFAADTLTDRTRWARERRHAVIWTLAALAALFIHGNAAITGQSAWAKTVIGILLGGATLVLVIRSFRRVHPALFFTLIAAAIGTAPVARSLDHFKWTGAQERANPWVSFAAGCAAFIPKDSVVMIPLTHQDFRAYALRSTFGSWKDGAPHLFCDKTLPEWWRRMRLFGVTLKTSKKELPTLYHNRAIEVARVEGIRYVVFEKARGVPTGPLLYENPAFGLIDLDAWTSADSLIIR